MQNGKPEQGPSPQKRTESGVLCPPPSVSVAMCTYNGAEFLPFQLHSIMEQTMLPSELVVCDDGSSDTTLDVLEKFRRSAPFPVRVHSNARTLGPAQNFGHCVALCSGDVILLTDQDDVWLPDRMEQTAAAFGADASVALTYSDAPLIDQHGREIGRTIYTSLPIRPQDATLVRAGGNLLPVLGRYNVLCGATMAFRASLRDSMLPIPPLWMHDEWIGLVGNALGRAVRLRRPAMRYRQHSNQQLGAGDWTIRTYMLVARERRDEFYESELQRLGYGVEAVRTHPELARVLLPLLEGKQAFYRDRIRIQGDGLGGLPKLLQLLFAGEYARYASAVRSPFKDLLMMVRRTAEPSAEA